MTTTTADPSAAPRPASLDDAAQLAPMLARSFDTCPAWRWYLPTDAKHRRERMERFFAFVLRGLYLRPGHECTTTFGLTGAALWDPPGSWKLKAGDNLRMLAVMVRVFGGTAPRAIRGFSALDAGHPIEAHWYLSVLGVDPEAHGAGVAEALIQPGIDRCDRDRIPAYVETGRTGSRDFFARHGFELTEELELPGGGPPVWRMWREPRSRIDRKERPTWPATGE